MSLVKCDECKLPVSNKALVCPNCGCPVSETILKNKKKQQRLVCILISAILGLAVVSLIAVKFFSAPDRSGYYNGIRWGSSSQVVLGQLPNTAHINEDKTTIISDEMDFCDLEGVSAIVMYELEDDSLSKVTIAISNPQSSPFTAKRITETIATNYDNQYGMHTTETISMIWKTPKSEIELTHLTEKLIFLTFTDNALLDVNSESA